MAFVDFKMAPTKDVSSTPVIIFGNDANTCIIDGILLSNKGSNAILVTLQVSREVETGFETYFTLANNININGNSQVDSLNNLTLTLQPGDLLYANSAYSEDSFDTFVSYRILAELGG